MDDRPIYQLEISLNGTDPAVFRVVDVPGWFSFAQFHLLIQAAMPWENDHLFEFHAFGHSKDKKGIRITDQDMVGDCPCYDPDDIYLSDIFITPTVWIKYWYDFGDDWIHTITLKSISPQEPGVAYPRLVEGANACPTENIGGIWRYYDLLGAWKNRESPDYWEARETFGRHFDPTRFDLKKAQKQLTPLNKIQPPKKLRIKPEISFEPPPPPKKSTRRKKPK